MNRVITAARNQRCSAYNKFVVLVTKKKQICCYCYVIYYNLWISKRRFNQISWKFNWENESRSQFCLRFLHFKHVTLKRSILPGFAAKVQYVCPNSMSFTDILINTRIDVKTIHLDVWFRRNWSNFILIFFFLDKIHFNI